MVVAAMVWIRCTWKRSWAALALVFTLNGFGHMLFDSIVGDIWWLAPFVDQPFSLFHVRGVYRPWWLNFILHWSFALELFLLAWAVWLWRLQSRPANW